MLQKASLAEFWFRQKRLYLGFYILELEIIFRVVIADILYHPV